MEKFKSRTRKSFEIFKDSQAFAPFGVHSNYRVLDPYPLYGSRARGSNIWDSDENQYLDFNLGFGALVVGHSHPVLVNALKERLEKGALLGLEFEDSDKLARILAQRFRVQRVRLSSTGAEATMHAIRLVRAFTRRRKILKFEGCYHGSSDSLLVSVKPKKDKSGDPHHPTPVPASKGIPPETISNTIVAPFNDIGAVEAIAKENRNDLAAMILEPIPMNMGLVLPDKGFLEALRAICDQYNALLLFDEVKTCGKYYGGAEERLRVIPDLKVLGKAIGGGFPLSAIGGRKEIMDTIIPGEVAHAGTFNSNPIAVTAGITTLTKILTEEALKQTSKLSDDLGKGCSDIARDNLLPAQVIFDGLSGIVSFCSKKIRNWRDFQESDVGTWFTYYIMMLNRGVIPAGTGPDEQWTVSVQHSKEDIAKHLEIFKEIAPKLQEKGLEMPIVEAL